MYQRLQWDGSRAPERSAAGQLRLAMDEPQLLGTVRPETIDYVFKKFWIFRLGTV